MILRNSHHNCWSASKLKSRRFIQHEHLGTLGLPAAEFLAVVHNTSYAGYAAHKHAGAIKSPFFQGTLSSHDTLPMVTFFSGSIYHSVIEQDAYKVTLILLYTNQEIRRNLDYGSNRCMMHFKFPSQSGVMLLSYSKSGLIWMLNHTHVYGVSHADNVSKSMQPVTIEPSGTFRQLLELMCSNRIHRVYVAERHGALLKPITVLTPTDVLRVVFTGNVRVQS